jgi:small subunit ribosomal protein S4e
MRLKRYAMPGWWRIAKKAYPWVTRPAPGPHPKNMCFPLQIVLRDILHVVENGDEAKKIIKAEKVLVDKKVRKSAAFPVGLMDIIELQDKVWRVVPDKRGLILKQAKQANLKLCRINGKHVISGGRFQLNLHDGRNIIVKEKKYKVGDSVLIKLPEQEIVEHIPLKVGQPAFIIAGKNIGISGIVKAINLRKTITEQATVLLSTSKGDVQTLRDYVMVGSFDKL